MKLQVNKTPSHYFKGTMTFRKGTGKKTTLAK